MRHWRTVVVFILILSLGAGACVAQTVRSLPKARRSGGETEKTDAQENADQPSTSTSRDEDATEDDDDDTDADDASDDESGINSDLDHAKITGTPDAELPEIVATVQALPLGERHQVRGHLLNWPIYKKDGTSRTCRILFASEDTFYILTDNVDIHAIPKSEISPTTVYLVRDLLRTNYELYNALNEARLKLLAAGEDKDQIKSANTTLDALLRDNKDLEDLIDSIRENPANAVVPPEIPDMAKEYADAMFEFVKEKVNDEMHLIETEHFLIYSTWPRGNDKGLEKVAEKLYDKLVDQFGLDDEPATEMPKMRIYCFWEKSEFQDFVDKCMPNVKPEAKKTSRKASGFCSGLGYTTYVVLNRVKDDRTSDEEARRRFYEVLTHETTHAFNRRAMSNEKLPTWLDEGLAEYMAAELVQDSYASSRWTDAVNEVVTENKDVSYNFKEFGKERIDYGACQSFLRYMIRNREGRGNFIEMYKQLKAGVPVETAMNATFEMSTSEFYRRWRDAID
jgi:hypothetical protein